jgi:hypothetical protein
MTMWKTLFAAQKRTIQYVLGHGFDERMCLGLEALASAGALEGGTITLLVFEEGPESASHAHADRRKANEERLAAVATRARAKVVPKTLQLISPEGRPIGGRNVARAFEAGRDVLPFTDVVVDISALPRGLYFPLIAKLLSIFDRAGSDSQRNLHVMVAHSPDLDAATHDEGIEESARFLHGFSSAEFELEATDQQPRVWVPVLGRGQQIQLERIQTLARPDEICPVLPSPAANPREADELILEYREFLFDRLRVEPRNIIYASESNPFEVYRQITRSIRDYKRVLEPLHGCKAVVSAMSSKLSSLGALLASYELRANSDRVEVGVAHVEAQGYSLTVPDVVPPPVLYDLWLAGECYAP